MPKRIDAFLKTSCDQFMAGHFGFITRSFTEPFALHIEDDYMSFQSREAFSRALASYRELLMRQGVTRVAPHVAAIEIPRRERYRAWVELSYFSGARREPQASKAIFYVRRLPMGLEVEMLQFMAFAHPQLKMLLPTERWSA